MTFFLKIPFLWLVTVLLALPSLAEAGIVIRGNRVIYDEAKGETVVQLRQAGDAVSLVQVWLDAGDDRLDGHLEPTPFMITPAVTRMDPNVGQSVRVLRVGSGLPQDRESLFFFNVLDIPSTPTGQVAAGDNYIQFSSRVRLKFFYRPKGLRLEPGKVHQLLRFSLLQDDAAQLQVRVDNPSPYHVTFKSISLRKGATEDAPELAKLSQHLGVNDTIVAPMSELLLPLDAVDDARVLPASGMQVDFAIVGDYGNVMSGQRVLE